MMALYKSISHANLLCWSAQGQWDAVSHGLFQEITPKLARLTGSELAFAIKDEAIRFAVAVQYSTTPPAPRRNLGSTRNLMSQNSVVRF